MFALLVACALPSSEFALHVGLNDRAPARTPVDGATPAECRDDSDGGIRQRASPSGLSMSVQRLTLIGAPGTPDADLFVAHDYDDALILDLIEQDGQETTAGLDRPAAGTYTGMELVLSHLGLTVPVAFAGEPDAKVAHAELRGWIQDRAPVLAQDVTTFVDDQEYWVTESGTLVSLTEDRPDDALSIWDDEAFWSTEDRVISTAEDSWADFRIELHGSDLQVLDTEEVGASMGFSAIDRLTWWETDGDGVLTLGQDCGTHMLFPMAELGWGGPQE